MCGRYTYTTSLEPGEVIFPEGEAAINLNPRYKCSPFSICTYYSSA